MSDTSLSSLGSVEEVDAPDLPNQRRRRVFRPRIDAFYIYDDVDFKMRFRFNKNTVLHILERIGQNLTPPTSRNHSIDARTQLLVALRYYATGSFQMTIGDTFNLNKSTVCRIVRRVTREIALLKPEYIRMPQNEEEQQNVAVKFFEIAEFPGVIGAVDCTHIKIKSPGGQHAEMFRNRKGYFSINTQAVCDADLKIMNIIARWPGSVHDSTIFNDSALRVDFERRIYNNFYLLGDSGYPCKNILLTPLLNPQNPSEVAYNHAHIRTRNTIERCFGILKKRFPCLLIGMTISLENTLPVIVACCVLHNIAINLRDEVPDIDPLIAQIIQQQIVPPDLVVDNENNVNTARRRALVNTVFAR